MFARDEIMKREYGRMGVRGRYFRSIYRKIPAMVHARFSWVRCDLKMPLKEGGLA